MKLRSKKIIQPKIDNLRKISKFSIFSNIVGQDNWILLFSERSNEDKTKFKAKTTIKTCYVRLDIGSTGHTVMVEPEVVNKLRGFDIKLDRLPKKVIELPRRSLRYKKLPDISASQTTKTDAPKTKQKALSIITPIQMSNILWRELTCRGFEIKVGCIVLAKMATFWPWPAQVTNLNSKRAHVKFFGDLRVGSIERFQCVPYFDFHSVVFNYLQTINEIHLIKWIKMLDNKLDEVNRPKIIRGMCLRQLYLQAVRDIEVYLKCERSMIDSLI